MEDFLEDFLVEVAAGFGKILLKKDNNDKRVYDPRS